MISKLMALLCATVVLLLIPSTQAQQNADLGTLIYSHVIFRHGDRAPSSPYPKDPYDESYWPNGWKQLTELGMKQAYNLGRFLRSEYIGKHKLLESTYTRKDDLYVRSTSKDRAVQTVQAMLAGMYPPPAEHEFVNGLRWYPIPVHTYIPYDKDVLLKITSVDCPKYDSMYSAAVKPVIKRYNQLYQNFFDYVKTNSGLKQVDFENIDDIYTAAYRENIHNYKQPDWLMRPWNSSVFNTTFDQVVWMSHEHDLFKNTFPGAAKLMSGYLLNDIIERMQDKINGNADPEKFVIYSAHSGTLTPLLINLVVKLTRPPTYTSTLLIDLYQTTGFGQNQYRVQLRYIDNKTPDEMQNRIPVIQSIPYCNNQNWCDLNVFTDALKDRVYKNKDEREAACSGVTSLTASLFLTSAFALLFF